MNRGWGAVKAGGRSLCWPTESADRDIKRVKLFSQMVLKSIFSRKEPEEQNEGQL